MCERVFNFHTIASRRSSLHCGSSLTSGSVSTFSIKNSRFRSGKRTFEMSSAICFLRSVRSCFIQFNTAVKTRSSLEIFSCEFDIKSCTWWRKWWKLWRGYIAVHTHYVHLSYYQSIKKWLLRYSINFPYMLLLYSLQKRVKFLRFATSIEWNYWTHKSSILFFFLISSYRQDRNAKVYNFWKQRQLRKWRVKNLVNCFG